ncbi:hypothetical protein Cpir12675_000977 [Ceratocystis pirilliformis]|uniref:Signal recognition particle subunit SRP14 n=1 Tax=Ceratocystis pirilliformis TaxID=259994 RepID=A0ABR3ZIZ6_9PEZI
MASNHLSNEDFFTRLEALFDDKKPKVHGSIYLVQKRLTYGQNIPTATDDSPTPDLDLAAPLPLIVRATNGKSKSKRKEKVKLSTVVQPGDLDRFYARYADICKAGMVALKPRDRSKKKAKAKKKKATTTTTATAVSTVS